MAYLEASFAIKIHVPYVKIIKEKQLKKRNRIRKSSPQDLVNEQTKLVKKNKWYKPLYRNGCSLFLSFSWTFWRWMKYSEKGLKNVS